MFYKNNFHIKLFINFILLLTNEYKIIIKITIFETYEFIIVISIKIVFYLLINS